MSEHLAFLLRDKHKTAIAIAMSLGVLLLLPSSLGFGRTMIMQEAFGQFNLPLLEDETVTEEEEDGGIVVEEEEEEETTTTTTTTTTTPTTPAAPTTSIQDLSTYLMADVNVDPVYGFIGSTLPTQGVGGGNTLTPEDDTGYIVTGPFRVFANESLVRRFVAEMNVAAVDGSSIHNITIQEGDPHRFEVTEGNVTNAAASSSIVGSLYLNGSPTAVINNVPMTISIRGQVLAIEGIDIDEARITDTRQRDIMSTLDGQSIYGTIPRT
jgi:hypothetical protein